MSVCSASDSRCSAVCSEADKRYLQQPRRVGADPRDSERLGAACARRRCAGEVTPPRIGFIGIFDYLPNASGVAWFVRECWPRHRRERAGLPAAARRARQRRAAGTRRAQASTGSGGSTTSADEASTWSAMIVPIRVGAGTRGKIAQAFGLKVPVVSTSLGAYGYDADGWRRDVPRRTGEPISPERLREDDSGG